MWHTAVRKLLRSAPMPCSWLPSLLFFCNAFSALSGQRIERTCCSPLLSLLLWRCLCTVYTVYVCTYVRTYVAVNTASYELLREHTRTPALLSVWSWETAVAAAAAYSALLTYLLNACFSVLLYYDGMDSCPFYSCHWRVHIPSRHASGFYFLGFFNMKK